MITGGRSAGLHLEGGNCVHCGSSWGVLLFMVVVAAILVLGVWLWSRHQ